MKNWSDSDPTLKIGDIVWSTYNTKDEFLYRIIEIERRFLDENEVKYHREVFPGCTVGEEYNPLITIEVIANLSSRVGPNKRLPQTHKMLDASYLVKATPEHIQSHIKRLNDLLTTFFP
jgi:hypothetical protein